MEIVLWLAFFFFVLKIMSPKPIKVTKACIMHKWVYKDAGDGNEYLVCSVCNKRPGEAIDDGSVV